MSLFTSNSIAEVCAVLSAILGMYCFVSYSLGVMSHLNYVDALEDN